jgi:NAD-dependent dihydropyrimidine dehydrogenase PreA subunit/nitroreductase
MESSINSDTCKKCKLCMEICPCNVIGADPGGQVVILEDRKSICIQCGHCMTVCSTKSIRIQGLSYDDDFFPLPDKTFDHRAFTDFISTRRSIRNFKDKKVPDKIIKQVLDSIAFAPFGAEPDKMCIQVVNDRKKIESALPHMESFLDNIVRWIENPVASHMIRRRNSPETFNTIKNHLYPIAKKENYKLRYGDRITRDAPALIIFHAEKDAEEHTRNAMIYATYTILAAHSLGLGATMIGLVPAAINKVKEVRDIFGIPDGNEAIISVILGYPKIKYRRGIKRNAHTVEWL